MKKLKSILSIVILLALCLTMLIPVYAAEEKEMVYANEKTQNEIYSLLIDSTFDYYAALQAENLTIVKESITRVYTASLLEYAQNGTLDVNPMTSGSEKNNVYIAKVVTMTGEYAGNIKFYVKDNIAYNLLFSPSPVLPEYYIGIETPRYIASCSYADHAQRIKGILKRTSFISIDNVKYVVIDNVIEGFLVKDESAFSIIPVGYISEVRLDAVDVILTDFDLSELASEYSDSYYRQINQKEEWMREHPDEQWSFTGEYLSPIISGVSKVDNINNIYEYLNISNTNLPVVKSNITQIIGIIAVSCLVVFITTICVVKRTKLKKAITNHY